MYFINSNQLTLELNQINAEAALLIQQAINIDVSLLFEKIFSCLHNIIQHAIKSKLHSQKIHNKSQSLQVEQCIQCINASLSQKVFGGVSISKQGNPNMKVKDSTQIPWYDTQLSSNAQQLKKFVDKHTCTTEDYYFNCFKVSSESIERQVEFESMIQFANESIAIMGEALSSRVLQTYKEQGKPEELNKLVHTIKFKKEDIDQVLKSIDLELLKDKIENYDKVEDQVRQHILLVQKQTAEKVFLYCKSLYKEKIKRSRNYSQDAIIRQQTFAKGDECRCQLYIGEILSLQNKTEQQQQLVQKQIGDLKDKERIIQGMELQQKLLEGQLKVHIQEKQELKQKLEQQNNQVGLSRRSTVFQRESSFLINQIDDQEGMSPRRKDPPQSRMYRSQILQPFVAQQVPQEQINTDQIQDLLRKDQMLERLIILINALDRTNKDKRLCQLQYVVEQKGERQQIDMLDLIKDIEENDLLMLESKSYGKSQNDIDDAKSPMNLPKQYHSQHVIDNREAPPKLNFQSSRDLNSPKVSLLEQIREIDENKHILLIPIEQDGNNKRKQSKNTSHSSFNSSNHVIDESPENKKSESLRQKVSRKSFNQQQSQEQKNDKMKRTSSIKLKINRKTSSQINKSNDLLSNPYGAASSTQPINSLTDRYHQSSIQQEDQFKFEKALDTEDHNRSGLNNHSQHDRTYTNNHIQSNLTTQHHTPMNSSRTYKLKAYNQNSDKYENIPFKQLSNSKDISQPKQHASQKQLKQDVESAVQNLQQTKFQQIKQQQKEGFSEYIQNQPQKEQSKATHQSNELIQKQKTTQETSQINILAEPIQQSKQGANANSAIENSENKPTSLRKLSKGNRSPESNIKTQTNDQVISSTFRQQFLDKLHASCEKQQSKTHRTQTSGDNSEFRQEGQMKDYINKQKDEYEKKLKEERTMFEQNLFEIGEQQEESIIRNAMNNKQGYMIAQDIDDAIMKQMFKNLKDQGSQITQTINKFYQKGEHSPIDYSQFHNFVNKFLNMHKRCGKDCIHVTRYLLKLNRFYMRLGFVPVKYLNKRKAMKLSKPVVLPGFPKV